MTTSNNSKMVGVQLDQMPQFYLILVVMGLIVVFSSSSFWMSWFGLELMTLFFLPFLSSTKSWVTSVQCWQYLVVQVSGSTILMLLVLFPLQVGVMSFYPFPSSSSLYSTLLSLPLVFKMAMPPFQSWVLNLSDLVSWLPFYVLNGLQKLGPLCLLYSMSSFDLHSSLTFVLILSSCMCLFGILDNSLRRVLVYSSILNLSWSLFLIHTDVPTSFAFVFVYLLILGCFLYILFSFNTYTIVSLYAITSTRSVPIQVATVLGFISVFGLPPFVGFQLKLESLLKISVSQAGLTWPSFLLLSSSLLMVVMYLHILHLSFLNKPSHKLRDSLVSPKVSILYTMTLLLSSANLLMV
nr:NADH dehydrogenase subunit 2 [Antarctophthirus carlinii]